INEAFRSGDWNTLAANMDPDVFVRADRSWPERRIYGRDAFIEFLQGLGQSMGPDIRIEETVDLGDRVITRYSWHARGTRSGVEGEQSVSEVSTLRDGSVVFVEYFLDHRDALKGLGLEE